LSYSDVIVYTWRLIWLIIVKIADGMMGKSVYPITHQGLRLLVVVLFLLITGAGKTMASVVHAGFMTGKGAKQPIHPEPQPQAVVNTHRLSRARGYQKASWVV
jgi:hypothetical protein